MAEYLRMSNLEIKDQIDSAVGNGDDRRREEEKKQELEEERGKKMLGRLGKKKKRNRKNKCGSQKKDEDWWFLEVPRRCLEIAAKIDAIPVGQEEEKKQEREDWWFDPEIEAKTNKIPVGQGYHIRGRFGDHIYVRRTVQDGCSLIGESPTKAVSCSVLYGAKFLSKTIKIAPDGFHSRLDRRCNDETKIIVKGKDSVCGVSRRNYKGGCLEATTFASAAPFCYGEKHGFPLDSDNYEEMMMPFSRVTFSLDTTVKEGCKDNEYTESKGCEDYLIEKNIEPLCDKDLAAQFNEQKAINYLENKLKQDPVIGHDETIETAITAFKYLLRDGFKSDEIKVYVVGKELWIERVLSVEEIEEHLAVVSD